MAFLVRFLIQYTFALLAFWTERANKLEEVWFILYLFLSGLIAPLEVFPKEVEALALLTPFPYLVYLPASVLAGIPTPFPLGQGLTVLLIWTGGFFLLYRLLWRLGLRRYSSLGA